MLTWSVDGGVALAGRACKAGELRDLLAEEADLLGGTSALAAELRVPVSSPRGRPETCFSQPNEHCVDRIRSRSFYGLRSRTRIEMLGRDLRVAETGLA